MSTLVPLLIVLLLGKISKQWDCPNEDIYTDENSAFPLQKTSPSGVIFDDHYPADASCLLKFIVPDQYYVNLLLNFEPTLGDSLTVVDDYGLQYVITNERIATPNEFAANFSFYIEPNVTSSGTLSATWVVFPAHIESTYTIDVVSGSFQTLDFVALCTSSTIAQKYIAHEPIILIFPNYTYSLDTSSTFFYQGEAVNGTFLGGIYNNKPNITVETLPYTLTVVTDCSKGIPLYLERDNAAILITQLYNVQRYSSYTFYLDGQRPLDIEADGITPAAVVIGCQIVVLDAVLSEDVYVEWYAGIAEPDSVPIAAFIRANATGASSGIYMPEGGNTIVVHNGTIHFIISNQAPSDHLPLAGGTAIAVTPNYGFSYLTHTYNWSYVATENFFYDIEVTSVECEEGISYFNFVYFGRPIRLNNGDTLRMFHISIFGLEFVGSENSIGGKMLFNATRSVPYTPGWGPPVSNYPVSASGVLPLLFIMLLILRE